jgi:hypothetical protein
MVSCPSEMESLKKISLEGNVGMKLVLCRLSLKCSENIHIEMTSREPKLKGALGWSYGFGRQQWVGIVQIRTVDEIVLEISEEEEKQWAKEGTLGM